MRFCGIDPGLDGGIAFLDVVGGEVRQFSTQMMPRYRMKVSLEGKLLNMVDVISVHEVVASQNPDAIIIERQVGYPTQSSVSTHTSGTNYGLILSLWTRKIPLFIVAPDQWKKRLGLTASKAEATALAKRLFGRLAPDRDGPAEALLICWYWKLETVG